MYLKNANPLKAANEEARTAIEPIGDSGITKNETRTRPVEVADTVLPSGVVAVALAVFVNSPTVVNVCVHVNEANAPGGRVVTLAGDTGLHKSSDTLTALNVKSLKFVTL